MGTDGALPGGAERFDEAWYLDANPDVAKAVAAGHLSSGLEHWTRFGRGEGRLPNGRPPASDEERRARVGAVWSDDVAAAPGWYWLAHPLVRARVNRLASGDPGQDAYGRLALLLGERGVPLPIPRAVSLGCGFGVLERNLAARGIVREVDAYDIAPGAIAEATRLAAEAGFDGLRYHVGDLETMSFAPGSVDVVFAHSAVHHVERLERLFAIVHEMLSPAGLFHLNEFIGPTRFQWTDAQMDLVNRFLERLPPRLRALPSGRPRPLQTRPTIASMIAADPSESVRSAEIVPLLHQGFDVIEERGLGGAVLHLALQEIAQNFDPDSPADRAELERLFAEEDAALRTGAIGHDFAILIAAKRSEPPPPAGERRLGLPVGFPLPGLETALAPADTMHGGSDAHYLAVGLSALSCIEAALAAPPARILDLPCGYGRVTRVLRARFPDAQLTVCDLDREAVDWTARVFGAQPAYSVHEFDQLALEGGYDLIWVGSLTTHLDATDTRAFLRAMARMMAPGGKLVVTSHGPDAALPLKTWFYGLDPAAAAAILDEYAAEGHGHRPYGGTGRYGISLTDRAWWHAAAAAAGLAIDAYHPQGWDGHQDVLVLRAGPPGSTEGLAAIVAARPDVAEYDGRLRVFDAAWYLQAYPDVREAVAAGHVSSAGEHWGRKGCEEGRRVQPDPARPTPVPASSRFDEVRYLQAHPDVAAAVRAGQIASAYDHWLSWGRKEGRASHG